MQTSRDPQAEAIAEQKRNWLDAVYDPLAGADTVAQTIAVAALEGKEWDLFVATQWAPLREGGSREKGNNLTFRGKLKTYRGSRLLSETPLFNQATALCAFYPTSDRPPALAVASGPTVYIYSDSNPPANFVLSPIDLTPLEAEAWNIISASNGSDQVDKSLVEALAEALRELRDGGVVQLSPQSLSLLSLEDAEERAVFAIECVRKPLCVQFQLSSAVVFLSASGLLDTGYSIVAVCRDGSIYYLNSSSCKHIVQLEAHACGLITDHGGVVVGCIDGAVYSYSMEGRKRFKMTMSAPIISMDRFDYPAKGFHGYAVALKNKEFRVYVGKNLIFLICAEDIVTALKFGPYGREPAALIMILQGGGLSIKILKRTADFSAQNSLGGTPKEQEIPIPVPKKTKLYVEQTDRERDSSKEMYQTFIRDLFRLRLHGARDYATLFRHSLNPISSTENVKVKLEINILGLGPVFLIKILIRNIGVTVIPSLILNLVPDPKLHSVKKPIIKLYYIVPGVEYTREAHISCVDDLKTSAGKIDVIISEPESERPVIMARVVVPACRSF
ncbi:ciliary BBSome complex subunit 1-domain-containing protein [Blyttiomyces helicus]|uniref:Ciliary BBSome complex subunit 1-domain-containing protein n=1 Tax=Blyttiomyces helicus TaxID=388810 RepID=A0A4P9WT17_9FUNG|nr:ciliary BBSome complex subunit 1-domain-containing protein [Blyttiomyces helicus]|eukprot:RKO94470.1 ciliary BBSome complex subunit 1-domain-containing protein [Blyttiomyces helicus]